MPDPDDQPPSQPTPATPQPDSQAVIAAALQQLLQPSPQPQVDQTPVERTWLSRLGGSLAGGLDPSIPMSPAQKQAAGMRALGDFGTSLMAASHYVPGQTIFSNLAQGFQGAQKGLLGSETTAAELLGAQQSYQQKQQEMQVERLKTALPLLTLQQQAQQLAAARAAASGNAPGAVTTTASPGSLSVTGGAPGAFAQSFTPIAQAISDKTGLPLQYVISQAGLETGWGTSGGAKNNNFFGITDPKTGKQMTYASPQEGADAYVSLMASDRYKDVPRTGTPQEIGDRMALAGYNPNVPAKDKTDSYGVRIGNFAASLAAPPAGPPAGPPPAASTATPAPPTAPRGAATLPTPPLPPEGMLPSPIAPAAAPASTAGQPAGGAVVAGPPGAATVGAARPPGPAVPGDVNAILRGMIARGASPATLAPGAVTGGPGTQAAGPAVTGGAQATAVAQAQATNTPVAVPGVKDLWALPNGQLTGRPPVGMPGTPPPPAAVTPSATSGVPPPASQATPPPATSPAPFVPQRMPLPPDIQARIDHPQIDPSFQSALNVALAGGDIAKIGEARAAIGTATDAARNKAIADGEAWQGKSAELQGQQADAERTQRFALALEAQKNKEVQVNTARDAERSGDKATLATYKTDADTAQGEINTLQILRNVEKNMPESGSVLLKQHPELLDTLSHMGLPREQADALGAMDLYQRMLGFLGTQLSQKAAAAGGTARQAEISSNMSVLPGLATDHAGRQQLTGFLLNLAQYRVNRAQAAEDYYYSSQHPDTSINPDKNLHTLIGFPQKFGADPSNAIIPQVPLKPDGTPDTDWAAAHVHPGMLAKFPQKVRGANNQPVLDANGKPTWQWTTGVQGDAP